MLVLLLGKDLQLSSALPSRGCDVEGMVTDLKFHIKVIKLFYEDPYYKDKYFVLHNVKYRSTV